MPYTTPDYLAIRDAILRDIANQQSDASIDADSDFTIRANATGSAIEGLYQHQQWLVRQILPDTADSDFLERHASLRGISRKPASAATGVVHLSGVVGSTIPALTETKTNSGVAIITTANTVIGAGGTVDVAARASVAGLAGNQAAATLLTLTAAPSGVLSQASIVTMSGGTDIEGDASLLSRLLAEIRLPPAGGAPSDYKTWALEVSGVLNAYIFTQRRSANSVDVVIEAVGGGIPSAQLIADVTAHIEAVRPCCVDMLVIAPSLVIVNLFAVLTLSGTTLTDATALIAARLSDYFATLHVGDSILRSKIIMLMMEVSGVADVNLTAPSANVSILADATHSQRAQLGVLTLTT